MSQVRFIVPGLAFAIPTYIDTTRLLIGITVVRKFSHANKPTRRSAPCKIVKCRAMTQLGYDCYAS